MRPPSGRTATACSPPRSPRPSSKRSAPGRGPQLLSREHFSFDGTLIEAAASLKSLRPIERGRQTRRRAAAAATPRSTGAASGAETRPTARPRPGGAPRAQGERPGGQALLRRPQPDREPQRPDRRLRADAGLGHGRARGRAAAAPPPAAPRALAHERRRRPRLRTKDFVAGVRALKVTPHVAARTASARSTAARRVTTATPSASAAANWSKNPSAGSRRLAACASCATAARPRRPRSSPSPARPTTSCACESCWRSPLRREVEGQERGPAGPPTRPRRARIIPPAADLGAAGVSAPLKAASSAAC